MEIKELRNELNRTILEAKGKPEKVVEKYLNDSFKGLTKHHNKPLLVKADKIKFEKATLKKGSKGNVVTINVKDFPIHSKGNEFDIFVKDETLTLSEIKGSVVMSFLGYDDDFSSTIPKGSDIGNDIIVNQIAINVFELIANLFTNEEILDETNKRLTSVAYRHRREVSNVRSGWADKYRTELVSNINIDNIDLDIMEYIEEYNLHSNLDAILDQNSELSVEDSNQGIESIEGTTNLSNTSPIKSEEVILEESVSKEIDLLTDSGRSLLSGDNVFTVNSSKSLTVIVDSVVVLFITDNALETSMEKDSDVSFEDYKAIAENLEEFSTNEIEDIKELAKNEGLSLVELNKGFDVGNGFKIEIDGNEYSYFQNLEDAESEAKDSIQNLIDDLGIMDTFAKGFAENHIDTDKLGRDLAMDGDFDRGYDEPENVLDEEPNGEDGDWSDEQRERAGEKADELFNERVTQDPLDYLSEIYGDDYEGFNMENYIDVDAVIQEAIDVDGIAHTIATYDGNEHDLQNGVAYRTN